MWKDVHLWENQKTYSEFQHLFKVDHSRPWTLPLRGSPCVPVVFWVNRLVLYWWHTCAVMCNYGCLYQQMHKKSSLQIICIYRWNSYLWNVSDTLGKTLKKLCGYGPFLWIGFNCLKATEPLRGDSLLFTIQFPVVHGTHLINLGSMKDWVDLRATQWFWTWDPWIENPAPNH